MTTDQHQMIVKARECIKQARLVLDNAMYYSDTPMPENEFKKVRKAYDALCSSNDLLP